MGRFEECEAQGGCGFEGEPCCRQSCPDYQHAEQTGIWKFRLGDFGRSLVMQLCEDLERTRVYAS